MTMDRALVKPAPKKPTLKRSPSVTERIADAVGRMFDRADPQVKARHDLAVNVAWFSVAVWAIHKWGHKLAV